MIRNFGNNTYQLKKADDFIPVGDNHFQPIFFAKNVTQIQRNPDAVRSLRKYRIWVAPQDVEAAIAEANK